MTKAFPKGELLRVVCFRRGLSGLQAQKPNESMARYGLPLSGIPSFHTAPGETERCAVVSAEMMEAGAQTHALWGRRIGVGFPAKP